MQQKFLIIQTAFIGDVVLASSMMESLHNRFPDAIIDLLVRKGNEGLVSHHPFLRKVLIWNKQEKKIPNLLRLLKVIRNEKYDRVVNVQRYTATGILTAFSGAKEKVGFDKNPLSLLFTKKIKHVFNVNEGIHEIERNHLLIADIVGGKPAKPRLYPSEEHRRYINQYLKEDYVTISPASVWFTKQYPPKQWALLIDSLPGHITVYLLGGPSDRAKCVSITQMVSNKQVVNLCGELNFLQSAALMQKAHMNFVNDSAPMHFAYAMNAPVTAVYCSTIPGFGYGPLSDKSYIVEVEENLYCRPCGLHGHRSCPQQHFKCASLIKNEQLLQHLDRVK